MSIVVTNMNIHGVKVLEATACSSNGTHWLNIYGREMVGDWLGKKFEITFFFDDLATAVEYANAINACNDREQTDNVDWDKMAEERLGQS